MAESQQFPPLYINLGLGLEPHQLKRIYQRMKKGQQIFRKIIFFIFFVFCLTAFTTHGYNGVSQGGYPPPPPEGGGGGGHGTCQPLYYYKVGGYCITSQP